jgi:hypothetical protein
MTTADVTELRVNRILRMDWMDWMEAPTGAMQRLHVGQKFHTTVSTTVETGRCCIHERRAITVSGNHRGMNTVLRIPRIFIAHTS